MSLPLSEKIPGQLSVCGQIGSGKTLLLQRILRIWPRVLVLDPAHDVTDGLIVYDWREAIDVLLRCEFSRSFRVIYRPERFDRAGCGHLFLAAYTAGDCCLAIDEAHYVTGPAQWKVPVLEEVFSMSRHQDLRVVVSSQRPVQVHKTILHQSCKVFLRMTEPSYLRDMREFFPDSEELRDLAEPSIDGRPARLAPRFVDPGRVKLDFRVWPLEYEGLFAGFRGG